MGVGPLALRNLIEAGEGFVAGILGQFLVAADALQRLGGLHAGRLAEHHQVDQRVGAQAVGAMHRDAGRFAHRHQAMHDGVGIAAGQGQRFAGIGAGNAAHVVMHRRQHRDRLLGHVDAGEDARAFPRCRAGARG